MSIKIGGMTRQWTITRLSIDSDGEIASYLEAVCDTEAKAKELMEDIYDDAQEEYSDKTGIVYSNPKWLNEEHTKLQLSASTFMSNLSYTETFFLSWIWKEKVINPKWILE